MHWDEDIAKLDMSDEEKNGLQVYRNYTRAFDRRKNEEFIKELDGESPDITSLEKVMHLVATEDLRSIPIIACAYADDTLLDIFKREMPGDVPGGSPALFGPYGPVSNLFNRLQLAYVFKLMSADVLQDLDLLRRVRNDISHNWDVEKLRFYAETGPATRLTGANLFLLTPSTVHLADYDQRPPTLRLRLRVIWLLCRLTYEGRFYYRAQKARLNPMETLYGLDRPRCLARMVQSAVENAGVAEETYQKGSHDGRASL
jgi:hypothetical protein